MVDIQRPGYARKKRLLRTLYGSLLVISLLAVTWAFSRLEPALPGVDRASVWVGEVERGSMVIEVRGNGTLVPEEIRWIAASTGGRVEGIPVLPGSFVRANTTLVVLDNPELEREALGADLELQRGIAELEYLKVDLQRQLLTQRAQAASVQSDYRRSQLEADKNEELAQQGLLSELDLQLFRVTAEELSKRHLLEQERLAMNSQALQAQLAAKEAEVSQLRGLFELRRKQVASLQVKAGIDGVLQQTPVEVGQQINTGEILGKVAVPGRLKAELQIPETQAQKVRLGLPAVVDTRNGVVSGEVVRIDPAAREGTVTVDVRFTEELPPGARPEQNIDGTIQIDRLDDVLKIGRPVFAQPDTTIRIFRLTQEGQEALRVPVRLGRTSVTTIQVVEGLAQGDRVILSDTSELDEFDRIRLN